MCYPPSLKFKLIKSTYLITVLNLALLIFIFKIYIHIIYNIREAILDILIFKQNIQSFNTKNIKSI